MKKSECPEAHCKLAGIITRSRISQFEFKKIYRHCAIVKRGENILNVINLYEYCFLLEFQIWLTFLISNQNGKFLRNWTMALGVGCTSAGRGGGRRMGRRRGSCVLGIVAGPDDGVIREMAPEKPSVSAHQARPGSPVTIKLLSFF